MAVVSRAEQDGLIVIAELPLDAEGKELWGFALTDKSAAMVEESGNDPLAKDAVVNFLMGYAGAIESVMTGLGETMSKEWKTAFEWLKRDGGRYYDG